MDHCLKQFSCMWSNAIAIFRAIYFYIYFLDCDHFLKQNIWSNMFGSFCLSLITSWSNFHPPASRSHEPRQSQLCKSSWLWGWWGWGGWWWWGSWGWCGMMSRIIIHMRIIIGINIWWSSLSSFSSSSPSSLSWMKIVFPASAAVGKLWIREYGAAGRAGGGWS